MSFEFDINTVDYCINDILLMVNLFKSYTIFMFTVKISIFDSDRFVRVWFHLKKWPFWYKTDISFRIAHVHA